MAGNETAVAYYIQFYFIWYSNICTCASRCENEFHILTIRYGGIWNHVATAINQSHYTQYDNNTSAISCWIDTCSQKCNMCWIIKYNILICIFRFLWWRFNRDLNIENQFLLSWEYNSSEHNKISIFQKAYIYKRYLWEYSGQKQLSPIQFWSFRAISMLTPISINLSLNHIIVLHKESQYLLGGEDYSTIRLAST